ncbi:MAG: isoprenyl transferase [Lachnospiraceae bacterium]|nr:isoprenyl transferase [Lachnospiraceae bacterium]
MTASGQSGESALLTNGIPEHVAIILDGNGRWARKKGRPRTYGHKIGAENVERICREAWDIGIKYLTVYAFSTENWTRPQEEVSVLMKLFGSYIKSTFKTAPKNNMRVRFIGDLTRFSPELRESMKSLEDFTSTLTGLTLVISVNYGSRDEIKRAVKGIAEDVLEGNVKTEDISEDLIGRYLDTSDIPDPDLLIRTSGEQRLSNFLLYQMAYTEFYFTDVAWPDFTRDELIKACEEYARRNRRYGGV